MPVWHGNCWDLILNCPESDKVTSPQEDFSLLFFCQLFIDSSSQPKVTSSAIVQFSGITLL